jgi:hypothetical protein
LKTKVEMALLAVNTYEVRSLAELAQKLAQRFFAPAQPPSVAQDARATLSQSPKKT